MQKVIDNNINEIEAMCRKYNVKSLFAFGSVCTNKFNNSSDIDLLISFEPMNHADYADNYFILAEKFEEIFHRKVDLITDKSLSNPFFIKSINKTMKVIYEK